MSNQIKQVVLSTISEQVGRVGYSLPSGANEVVEAVADRLADFAEETAKAIVERVQRDHGYGAQAEALLTEFGFISEPEPEPVVEDSDEDDDEDSRLSRLEATVQRLVALAERHLGRV